MVSPWTSNAYKWIGLVISDEKSQCDNGVIIPREYLFIVPSKVEILDNGRNKQ
jgi:hypothetical protein